MTKNELRRHYKTLRKEISENESHRLSIAIANQLLKLPIWEHDFFHVFMPIAKQNEVNTDYLIAILQGKNKNIVVSKSDFDTVSMLHFLMDDETVFEINNYGIPEPKNGQSISVEQIEVVFVPLLAFDLKGNRVGYGKGFYDKFLKQCNANVIKIGLSFFDVLPQEIETNQNDIGLDICATPNKIYEF
jgi:5-formyltetrahydrofolate cyclo-ligase